MKIGALDRRIRIEAFTSTRDPDTNEEIRDWALLAEAWANRRDVSAREFFAAGGQNTEQLSVFTIRWRTGINQSLRVTHDGQVFDITGVSEIGRRQFLSLQGKALNSDAES